MIMYDSRFEVKKFFPFSSFECITSRKDSKSPGHNYKTTATSKVNNKDWQEADDSWKNFHRCDSL